jgi:hypothetical protein
LQLINKLIFNDNLNLTFSTQIIKAEGQLVDLVQRISVLNKYEKVIFNGNSPLARWLKGTTNVFPNWIPSGRVVVFPNDNNSIRTLKEPVKSNNNGDEEMQTLNNNYVSNADSKNYMKIIVNEWLPQKFQGEATMDQKIMKKIKHVLQEKKNREVQEQNEEYRRKMDRKILRNLINLKIQNNKIEQDITK